jgi:hypothetical protein
MTLGSSAKENFEIARTDASKFRRPMFIGHFGVANTASGIPGECPLPAQCLEPRNAGRYVGHIQDWRDVSYLHLRTPRTGIVD